jgi:hypothetical protein
MLASALSAVRHTDTNEDMSIQRPKTRQLFHDDEFRRRMRDSPDTTHEVIALNLKS